MESDFFEKIRQRIKATGMSQAQLARQTGTQQGSLSRFLNGGQDSLGGDTVAKLVKFFGAKLVFPDEEKVVEPDKDVCFVNARVVPAGEGVTPPQAEDYIAAPMVGEVGAGPGYIPPEEVKSWFLAYKHHPAVRLRRNLLAVELGKSSDSMMPTLNPGDIVLVDRDDRDVQRPGHMMLVCDPDGAGMIKRVSVREEGHDFRITFYSDNATKHPPLVYSLREDYLDDWDRAIVGRAIWAWSDIREK